MTQQETRQQTQTQTKTEATDFERLLKQGGGKAVEYVPFGANSTIKLSVKIVMDIIAVPTKTGKLCTEKEALKFLMMCHARKLNPFEGDAFLVGYDTQKGPQFSLITSHQAFLKRAEVHPEFDGMESGVVVVEGDGPPMDIAGDFYAVGQEVVGGWAKVHFKNRKIPTYRRIRIERFNNGFAQWEKDAAGMICKCAEADALRSSFPTMVGGLYLREEDFDFMPPQANGKSHEPETSLISRVEPQSQVEEPPKREESPATEAVKAEMGPPQKQLESILEAAGISFSQFQTWAVETNAVRGADSLTMFDEVPAADAKRLLRSTDGLIQQINLSKA